jgi:phage tail sheath protein FI
MAIAVSYPGVYIGELSSGVRTIVGVSTSVGMFLGRARMGEISRPVRCLSYADFERAFSLDTTQGDLPRAVKLFFDNGGSECFVMRISDGTAVPAALTLRDETKVDTLTVAAKSAGLFGNDIRLSVNYNTAAPEGTFNLEVFRWTTASNGALQKSQIETYAGLSMDPVHPRYVEDVVNVASTLVAVTDLRKGIPLAGNGLAVSGFAVAARTNAIFQTQMAALLTPTQNKLRIGIGGRSPAAIDLASVVAGFPFASVAALENALTTTINSQLPPGAAVQVVFQAGPTGPAAAPNENQATQIMTIAGVTADIVIEPSPVQDLAGPLMLGTGQGGIEIPRSSGRRPAPTGVVFRADFAAFPNAFVNFGQVQQSTVNAVRVAGVEIPLAGAESLQTTPSPPVNQPRMYQEATATNQVDGRNGIREKFGRIASAINNKRAADSNFRWSAEVWGTRLAVIAVGDVPDLATTTLDAGFIAPPFAVVPNVFGTVGQPMTQNVRYYALAAPPPPPGAYYGGGVSGFDGGPPLPQHYEAAYKVIDREVDLFNLMVLPRDVAHTNATMRALWAPASNFCEQRRAFLLIDPPPDWTDHDKAVSAAIGVNTLRVGLSKQYSAVFFPNLIIREGLKEIAVGPAGAIAGLMARIDGTRGVWKAPAGVEADLRGVIGVQRRLSDGENGVLNPRAVNAIRLFPNGIVAWGARTMDGDDAFASEYKFIPVRRLANFIEESLYRGLTWAVFEPNDEPLWGQIRLNVGAFMHNLFRQGAFQGATPRESYFVRCDSTTTTQNDINLGIVNIIVGFAPLKPAEFVVLYLQQMAGQIQT